MKLDDDLDRILSSDGEIVPSAGFANSVMDTVRREASVPPAIPFPWKRVLPALIFAVVAFVSAVILGFDQLVAAITVPPLPAVFQIRLEAAMRSSLIAESGWIVLAVLLALVSVNLSMRFVSRESGH
jgi:hypothetical protein